MRAAAPQRDSLRVRTTAAGATAVVQCPLPLCGALRRVPVAGGWWAFILVRQGPESPSSALQAWLEREWGSPWRETVATWRCISQGWTKADKLRLGRAPNELPDPNSLPILQSQSNPQADPPPNLSTTCGLFRIYFSTRCELRGPDEAVASWVAKWHVGTEGSVSAPTPPYIETQHAVTSLHFREAGSPHIADHRLTSLHSNSHPVLAATVFSSDSSLKTAGFKSDPRKLPLGSSHRQRQPTW